MWGGTPMRGGSPVRGGHPCYLSVGISTESPLLATCLDYWRRRQFSHVLSIYRLLRVAPKTEVPLKFILIIHASAVTSYKIILQSPCDTGNKEGLRVCRSPACELLGAVCWAWSPERYFLSLSVGPDIVIQSEASSSKTVLKPNDKSLLKKERPPSPREDNTRMEPENQVVRLQAYRCQQWPEVQGPPRC